VTHPNAIPRLRAIVVLALSWLLVSCEPEFNGKIPRKPKVLATEPLSRQIEEFVGGHAKVVWSSQIEGSKADPFGREENLELWGIDTRDGKGRRKILSEPSNYSRPLISPSGDHIVFTHKGTERKGDSKVVEFDPVVFRVDWDGTHLEKLAAGYAADIWRDPVTSVEWVYVTDMLPLSRATPLASKLERFKLLDPGERELVWDRTNLGTENIQLSHDGTRASALFPWPDAGVMNLTEMTHRKNRTGCWPSIAPDNSRLAWVFDGSHKNLHFYDDEGNKGWAVPVNTVPGLGGHEIYHPRWSNHVRFLSITGPYEGKSISRSDVGGVEVHLGRFSEDLKSIESWLTITDDNRGDAFPDLWIAYSETRGLVLEETSGADPAPKKAKTPPAREWPVTNLPLLFVWEDGEADNLAGEGATRRVGVDARERARFGPRFEMLADGGRFEADAGSSKAVSAYFAGDKAPFTLEVLATPLSEEQDGVVVGNEHFQLKQRGSEWVFVSDRPRHAKLWIGRAKVGEPHHLVIAFDGAEFTVFHNGKTVSQASKEVTGVEMLAGRRGLTFGSGWDGAIEAVSLAPGRLDESRIEAGWKYLQKKIAARQPIPRVRLRGKLLEMSADRPVEALDTYQRGLLGYLYSVEEVLEGSYEGDKVVVVHWTILDRNPLQGFPRRPGESYELLLEPYDAHPELSSERQWNDIPEPLDPYYDVATPKE
jgi:hypothetical protein